MSEKPQFAYTPPTEEEIWRQCEMGELWDRAEAGEPIPALLRERLRAAEKAFNTKYRPEFEAFFMEPSGPCADGLALLIDTDLPPPAENT